MHIKLTIIFLFIFCFNSFSDEQDNIVTLKNLNSINNNIKYDKFIDIYNGRVEIDQDPDRIYLFSNEKYYTTIDYNNQFRTLSNRNKDFFMKWLQAKYMNNENVQNIAIDTKIPLIDAQIDLFYKELMIIDNGRVYNFIIQIPLYNKMLKNLTKNEKVQLELMYLGKNYNTGTNFFLISDFSKNDISKKNNNDNEIISAKKLISSKKYNAAILKLNSFIKKNPDNLEAKKDICLAKYLVAQKIYENSKDILDVINCYESLLKSYKSAEVYYMLATLYYSQNFTKNSYKEVLKYSNKAIEYFKIEGKDSGANQILYCNSLYLRGLAKIALNDNDGLMDIEHTQNKCPELINVNQFANY